MEEVIEELKTHAEDISFPQALPTEDELLSVEEEMLVQLPYDLRIFLLEVSNLVCGAIEPVTAADPRAHTYLPELAALAWDNGLPREFIPICQYDDGYACIAPDGEVSFFANEGFSDEHWETIWHWCREIWMTS